MQAKMQEGRLFARQLAERAPALDEIEAPKLGLPRHSVLKAYFLRTRGSPAKFEVGLWAWALHRVTGLGIVAYVAVHIALLLSVQSKEELQQAISSHSPYYEIILVLAVGGITYHALNGLRLVLGDSGILPMRSQHKVAVWAAGAVAILAMLGTLGRFLS